MESIELSALSKAERVALVFTLGYRTDGTRILHEDGSVLHDKYTGSPVTLQNMAVLPGSTIILENNELSLAHYIQEYGNPFE